VSKNLDTRTDDGEPPALRRSGIDCAEAHDLIPALALGVIETGERHALWLHCQICPDCEQILGSSEQAAAFLPFAAPGQTPPDRAKHTLFARIADARPAPALSTPTLSSTLTIDPPLFDSPAAKRSASRRPSPTPTPVPAGSTWPRFDLSHRVSRLAVGSLALALVLVTIYSLQGIDTSPDNSSDGATSGDQVAQVATTISTSVAASAGQSEPTIAGSDTSFPSADTNQPASDGDLADLTFVSTDTQGASATEPVFQQYSSAIGGPLVYRAVSSGGQTELLRSVAPSFASCSIVITETGELALNVTGVQLPGGARVAGVYLVTYSGERVYAGSMEIDEQGNGAVTFPVDRPLEQFRSLQLGPVLLEPGAVTDAPFFSAASFSLASSSSPRGLSPSS